MSMNNEGGVNLQQIHGFSIVFENITVSTLTNSINEIR